MTNICLKCRKQINGFCKVSGERINKTRNKCKKYKVKHQKEGWINEQQDLRRFYKQ